MASSEQESTRERSVRYARAVRFAAGDDRNGRIALGLALDDPVAHRDVAIEPWGRERRSPMRRSIGVLVELSAAAHGLSIQRRLLSDFGSADPALSTLESVDRRVQAAAAAIVRRCVARLLTDPDRVRSPAGLYRSVTDAADERLRQATDAPEHALDLLPPEIADDVASALALEPDLAAASPYLLRAAASAVTLFVVAGLPYDRPA